jgi:hypothetical protein
MKTLHLCSQRLYAIAPLDCGDLVRSLLEERGFYAKRCFSPFAASEWNPIEPCDQ